MASPEERDLQKIADALARIKKEAREASAPVADLRKELAGFTGVLEVAGISTAGIKMPATQQWGGRYRRSYLESFGMGAAEQLPPYLRPYAAEALSGQAMPKVVEQFTEMAGGAQQAQRMLDMVSHSLGGVQIGVQNLSRIMPESAKGFTRFAFTAEDGIGRAVVQMDKLGRMTVGTTRATRDFFQMVTRNLGKVVQWAIAVGVVYGALSKVSQMMTDMREFQNLFADIAIVMGETAEEATRFFDTMYETAKITGTTVKEVAVSLDDALRVTASYTDEEERMRVATQLLVDSMTLAKIANLDSATSFDMLIGAIRQAGLEVDQGTILLDKWVAVSRVAATSVQDMAQGFAITGQAAQTAGVNFDQLNGMIAGMAEVTTLSSTEAGNAIRAFMSSFTTERSITALQQYGFAVKDLDGDFRSLWDILSEVAAAYETGALSPTGLKEITDAIGGGYRRAAQVEALIKGWPRVQFAAKVSMDAHGDAADALSIKMETLQTAMNQLTSSWQRLAQTIAEAGLLEDLTKIVQAMASLLDIISTLTEKLGPFLIRMAEMMAVLGLAQYVGPRIAGLAGISFGAGAMQMAIPGMAAGGAMAGMAGFAARNAGPLALAATAIIPVITEGLTQEAAWQSAGGLLAGAVGLVLGGPMGAIIGSVIGQAFVSHVQSERDKLAIPMAEVSMEELLAERRELEAQIKSLKTHALVPELRVAPLEERIKEINQEIEARKRIVESGLEDEEDIIKDYYARISALEDKINQELPNKRKRMLDLLRRYTEGEITKAEYTALAEQLTITFETIATAYYQLAEVLGVGAPELFETLAGTSREVFDEIISRVAARSTLEVEMLKLRQEYGKAGRDEIAISDEIYKRHKEILRIDEELALLWPLAKKGEVVPEEMPTIFDLSRIKEEDLPEIFDLALQMQQQLADEFGISLETTFEEAAYAGFIESGVFMTIGQEINRQILGMAIRALEEAAEEFNLQRIKDIGEMPAKAWFDKLTQLITYYQRLFTSIGFTPEQQEIVLMLGPQNEIFRLITSQEALRYALDDLRDMTEEQTDVLRGHFNIPAGYIVPTPWDYYATTGSPVAGPVNYPASVLQRYYGYQFGGAPTGIGGLPTPTTPVGPVEYGAWMGRIPRSPDWDVGDWTELIMQYALAAGVDPRIVAAIMQVESGGVPTAIGAPTKWGRAAGLMQIMPFHAGRLQPGETLMQPEANIRIGIEIFKELLEKYQGDMLKAVASYYGGVVEGEITPSGEMYLDLFKKAFAGMFGAEVGEIQQVAGIPEIQRVLESTKVSTENYGAQSIIQLIQIASLLRSILAAFQASNGGTVKVELTPPTFTADMGESIRANERPGGILLGGLTEF